MKRTCIWCGKEVTLNVTREEMDAWIDGALIQDAMPNVPAEDREMLISGTCGTCWDSMIL